MKLFYLIFLMFSFSEAYGAAASASSAGCPVAKSRFQVAPDLSDSAELYDKRPVKRIAENYGRMGAFELLLSGVSPEKIKSIIETDPTKLPRPDGCLIVSHSPDGSFTKGRTSIDFIRDYLSTYGREVESPYVLEQAERIKRFGMDCFYGALIASAEEIGPRLRPSITLGPQAFHAAGQQMFREESDEIIHWIHRCRREYPENPAHQLMEHVRLIAQEEFWRIYYMEEALKQSPTSWTEENFSLFHIFDKIPDPVMKEVMRAITLSSIREIRLMWDNFLQKFTYRVKEIKETPSEFIRRFYKDYPLFRKDISISDILHIPDGFTEHSEKDMSVVIFYRHTLGIASRFFHSEASELFHPDSVLREGVQAHFLEFGIDEGTLQDATTLPLEERNKAGVLVPHVRRVKFARKGLSGLFSFLENLPQRISQRRKTMLGAAALYDRYARNPSAFSLLIKHPAVVVAEARKTEQEGVGRLGLEEKESNQRVAILAEAIAETSKNLENAIKLARQHAARVRRREEAEAALSEAAESEEEKRLRIEQERVQEEKFRLEQLRIQEKLEEQRRHQEAEERRRHEIRDRIREENSRLTEERRERRAGFAAAASAGGKESPEKLSEEEAELLRQAMPTVKLELSTEAGALIDKVLASVATIDEIRTMFESLGYTITYAKTGFKVKYVGVGQDFMMKTFHPEHGGYERDKASYEAAIDLLRLGGYI